MPDDDENAEAARQRLKRSTPDITPMAAPTSGESGIQRQHVRVDVPAGEMPIPAIARATLLALGCKDAGPAEKVAWRAPFDFHGHPCVLKDQKLGVNIHLWVPAEWDEREVAAFGSRTLATIRQAIRVAESAIVGTAIKDQIDRGQVTLVTSPDAPRDPSGSITTSHQRIRLGVTQGAI